MYCIHLIDQLHQRYPCLYQYNIIPCKAVYEQTLQK